MICLTYLVQIPLYPILGYILDKYGRRIQMMYLTVYLFLLSFLLFNYIQPYYITLLNGIVLSLMISVSRSIFYFVVKKKQVGIGLGIINSYISLLIIFFNFIANEIFKDTDNNYCHSNCIIYFYVLLIIINLIFCHITGYIDSKRPISLNSNENQKLEEIIG